MLIMVNVGNLFSRVKSTYCGIVVFGDTISILGLERKKSVHLDQFTLLAEVLYSQ